MLEVLNDFRSARPSLAWLLESCPLMKPRYFSIASSPKLRPNEAHVTAAIVQWTTPYKRVKHGLCTSWLARLQPTVAAVGTGDEVAAQSPAAGGLKGIEPATCRIDNSVTLASFQPNGSPAVGSSGADSCQQPAALPPLAPVWVEKGALRMPSSVDRPMILIGPGTGIAPFRSFLEQRFAQLQSGVGGLAPCYLFFGCRNQSGDFLYRDQWLQYQASGVLHCKSGLVTAFSRDQQQKLYVTHRIKEHGALLWRLVSEYQAVIYVSGSAQKMPSDVGAAFEQVFQEHGGMDAAAAQKCRRQLELTGRYNVEAWS